MAKKKLDNTKLTVAFNPNEIDFEKSSLENLYTLLGQNKLNPDNKSRVLELIALKQSDSDRRVMAKAVMSDAEKTQSRVNELKQDFHKVLKGFVTSNKEELCKAKTLLAKTAQGEDKGSWSAFSITEPVKVGSEALSFQIVCQVTNQRVTKRLYSKLDYDAQQAILAERRQAAIDEAWNSGQ